MTRGLGGFTGGYHPTSANPSGVYTIQDVYNQMNSNEWPGTPSITAVPPYQTGFNNGEWDTTNKRGFWNNEKGIIVSSEDIFTTTQRGWDSAGYTGYNSGVSANLLVVPFSLWWVYALVIGGGGGGNGNGNGDGAGGGGWAWAKLDLRQYVGSTISCVAANGGNINASGGTSYLRIDGQNILTATGGNTYASNGNGGTGTVNSGHATVVRYLTSSGGSGSDNAPGGAGATGGGGGGPTNGFGGAANRPFGGAGTGNDGGGFKPGGVNNTGYSSSIYTDTDRGQVWITAAQAHNAVNQLGYFSGSTSNTWNNGKPGRSSTTSGVSGGTFGSGGGGSGSGSGYEGGPGVVILWWDS